MARKGLIFDIQRQCIHDGDGVRTVLFVKGCPLRCGWCANPESQRMMPEIAVLPQRCIGDGSCMRACPHQAVTAPAQIDRTRCIQCGKCAELCYPEALSVFGRWVDSDEIGEELLRDRLFFLRGGGVTISGGEPFCQAGFVKAVLRKLHSSGIHTAVETSGYAHIDDMLEADVDQFLFDVKLMDEAEHVRWTGVSNRRILENLRVLAAKRRVTLRMPMIPGVNDDEKNLSELAQLALCLGIQELHVLPFHQLGAGKYQMLGMAYRLEKKPTPAPQEVDRAVKLLRQFGIQPIVGG